MLISILSGLNGMSVLHLVRVKTTPSVIIIRHSHGERYNSPEVTGMLLSILDRNKILYI